MLAAGVALGSIPSMAKDSPRLRVLVVDDEPLIRWSLSETLEQSGHAVVEAAMPQRRSIGVGGRAIRCRAARLPPAGFERPRTARDHQGARAGEQP